VKVTDIAILISTNWFAMTNLNIINHVFSLKESRPQLYIFKGFSRMWTFVKKVIKSQISWKVGNILTSSVIISPQGGLCSMELQVFTNIISGLYSNILFIGLESLTSIKSSRIIHLKVQYGQNFIFVINFEWTCNVTLVNMWEFLK
jgi:hypothetical protein